MIKRYKFKPDPIFFITDSEKLAIPFRSHPEGTRMYDVDSNLAEMNAYKTPFYGVELEVEGDRNRVIESFGKQTVKTSDRLKKNGNSALVAVWKSIQKINNLGFYIKTDSSLDDGVELVSHPRSYNSWLSKYLEIKDLFISLRSTGIRGDRPRCGFHIHMGFDSFCSIPHMFSFFKLFVELQPRILSKENRSTESIDKYCSVVPHWKYLAQAFLSVTEWVKGPQQKKLVQKIIGSIHFPQEIHHHKAIAITDFTVEIRMFSGTTSALKFARTLALVEAIRIYTAQHSYASINIHNFIEWLKSSENKLFQIVGRKLALNRNEVYQDTESFLEHQLHNDKKNKKTHNNQKLPVQTYQSVQYIETPILKNAFQPFVGETSAFVPFSVWRGATPVGLGHITSWINLFATTQGLPPHHAAHVFRDNNVSFILPSLLLPPYDEKHIWNTIYLLGLWGINLTHEELTKLSEQVKEIVTDALVHKRSYLDSIDAVCRLNPIPEKFLDYHRVILNNESKLLRNYPGKNYSTVHRMAKTIHFLALDITPVDYKTIYNKLEAINRDVLTAKQEFERETRIIFFNGNQAQQCANIIQDLANCNVVLTDALNDVLRIIYFYVIYLLAKPCKLNLNRVQYVKSVVFEENYDEQAVLQYEDVLELLESSCMAATILSKKPNGGNIIKKGTPFLQNIIGWPAHYANLVFLNNPAMLSKVKLYKILDSIFCKAKRNTEDYGRADGPRNPFYFDDNLPRQGLPRPSLEMTDEPQWRTQFSVENQVSSATIAFVGDDVLAESPTEAFVGDDGFAELPTDTE